MQKYINREISWLHFNKRVLEEAGNENHPLLERVRFLSISATNLDEFFSVRVAGLMGQVRAGVNQKSIDGQSPEQTLTQIESMVKALNAEQQALYKSLVGQLCEKNIHICAINELNEEELLQLSNIFELSIFPLLTPLAIDTSHPFPFIQTLGFTLAFLLQKGTETPLQALVRLPNNTPRFVHLPINNKSQKIVLLEEVVTHFSNRLFPQYKVKGQGAFRILRDSDLEIEEEAEDLVRHIESGLKRRRRGRAIRLEMQAAMPKALREMVMEGVNFHEVTLKSELLGLNDLSELCALPRQDLLFKPYSPRYPERITQFNGDCFAAIRHKDLLVHHPYETFDVVVEFLNQAAKDPTVLAIKQTLYRTSATNSPIVRALIEAAEAGKNVTALIELKARFDEETNLKWARDLERAGVQVVYGFVELKTHAKLSLVIRRENDDLIAYCHIGTGNYHPQTAKVYTDLSLFTVNPLITSDVTAVFNYITGTAAPQNLKQLLISPLSLKAKLITLIRAEIEHVKQGKPAAIWAKMNSLVDPAIIDALYEASSAGVKIELVVRGICCLRPQVKGLSENIRVKSIVGRFLEHGRIAAFGNGFGLPHKEALVYIGSADWMPRNLDRRVEVICPILNETVHAQVLEQIMVANLKDNEQSWQLLPDGSSQRMRGDIGFNCHKYFMTNVSLSGRGQVKK